MANELGASTSTTFTGQPPFMSVEDTKLWVRWRPFAKKDALRWYFRVLLGPPRWAPPGTPVEILKAWEASTRRRVDLIIEYPQEIMLVELRKNANPNAIGRVLVYQYLWLANPLITKRYRQAIVSNLAERDTFEVSRRYGIEYYTV